MKIIEKLNNLTLILRQKATMCVIPRVLPFWLSIDGKSAIIFTQPIHLP